MKFFRSTGILLHPTSLPGDFGIGEIGPEAFAFVDFLALAGMKIWQVLPLGPTGYGDSPYQSFSAFAGNPLLISLHALIAKGILSPDDVADAPAFPNSQVDFGEVIKFKFPVLRKAARNFFNCSEPEDHEAYEAFCRAESAWLDDFTLFMAAKTAHEMREWTEWDADLAARKPEAMEKWRTHLKDDIDFNRYLQFEFFRQWSALKMYCFDRGIQLMGDIPIYVAHDSADVWANPQLFFLDDNGRPTKVAGVPPDYFSATGQLWGNPIYRWDAMRLDGFRWWVERFRATLRLVDFMRLDHFRGFEAYWEVPASESTAIKGRWVKGPGSKFFRTIEQAFGTLPIIAENLGVITPEVEAIRHEFDLPGMAILQFAFSTDEQAPTFRPHNYVRNLVAYTGGHDNDTMCGWWRSGVADSTRSEGEVEKEKQDCADYFGVTREQLDREVNWVFIREVMRSVADTAVISMQDVLGLDSDARMNLPGSVGRWWKWRMLPGAAKPEYAARLRKFSTMYDR